MNSMIQEYECLILFIMKYFEIMFLVCNGQDFAICICDMKSSMY